MKNFRSLVRLDIILLAGFLIVSSAVSAQALQHLVGHVRDDVKGLKDLGFKNSEDRMVIILGFHFEDLANSGAQPPIRRYGATTKEMSSVLKFLKSFGMKFETKSAVAGANSVLAWGTVSQVENALHVKIHNYKWPDGTVRFATDREPSLKLDVPVGHISGLDDFSRGASHPVGLGTN